MNFGWQDWVVALLIIACVVRIAFSVRSFFRNSKENKNPCSSCASGCELKSQFEKKQQQCRDSRPSAKKKCCG